MIETSLNVVDAAVFAIMAISCLHAFFRGFVREMLSLSAWALAGVVTLYFFPSVAEHLQPKFKNAVVAAGFATLGIYTLSLMGFSLLNTAILKFIKSGTDVGLLDNSLGLAFGAARGAFLLSLAFFIMTISIPEEEYPKVIQTSISMPYLERGAIMLAKASPKYLRDLSTLNKKIIEEENQKSAGGIGKISNPFADEFEATKEKKKSHDE
ncbi:MAG: CvpA family protein [Alphaproteobacteria bacterium]|nr:CvpA family protein [Alphaproteobacteria bacterium]